jgi:Putative Flp pilus-assembly TadE/G-like
MPSRFVRLLFTAIMRLLRDEHGASATVLAVALPTLIGFGALGAETGLWYSIKRHNQTAADAAAISAAYEVLAGKSDVTGDLTVAANEAAGQNGYTGAAPGVVYPYSDGIASSGVAVTLQQTQRGLLSSLFFSGVTVATTAVAVFRVLDNPCILALGTSGTDVEVGASASLNATDCSVAANSTSQSAIDVHDNTGSIDAETLFTAGGITVAGNPLDPAALPPEITLASRPMIGAPTIRNPYRDLTHTLLTSSVPTTRIRRKFWNEPTTTIIHPGLYERGMSFGARAVITLTPGLYYLTNGDFSVAPGARLTGTGVAIVLTTTNATAGTVGNVKISPGARVTLSAPSSGSFSGILFVQDPLARSSGSTTPDNTLEGGAGMGLNGLLYFPNTTVGFGGNAGATCTLLITSQLVITETSNFNMSGCPAAGLTRQPSIYTVALAE